MQSTARGSGGVKAKILTSPNEERPRDVVYDFVIDRLASLSVHATIACREPTCGARDEEGNLVSCESKDCGEKLMLSGWRRELRVMRVVKAWVEGLERAEQQKHAAEDKANRGKR